MSDTTFPRRIAWRTPWRAVAAAFAFNGILLGIWAARIPAATHGAVEVRPVHVDEEA